MPHGGKLITSVIHVNLNCHCKNHTENTSYESNCEANLMMLCEYPSFQLNMVLLLLSFVHKFKNEDASLNIVSVCWYFQRFH